MLSTKLTLSHHWRKFCRGLSSEPSATCQHMDKNWIINTMIRHVWPTAMVLSKCSRHSCRLHVYNYRRVTTSLLLFLHVWQHMWFPLNSYWWLFQNYNSYDLLLTASLNELWWRVNGDSILMNTVISVVKNIKEGTQNNYSDLTLDRMSCRVVNTKCFYKTTL